MDKMGVSPEMKSRIKWEHVTQQKRQSKLGLSLFLSISKLAGSPLSLSRLYIAEARKSIALIIV